MLAIVLSRHDFRENDQIISLYTLERGKITALARGVKKIISKNSACLEPFFLVEAEIVPGKDISHLTKIQPINIFKNIRADLQKILMAGYVMNLLDKFLQTGERDERIFNLIKSWLEFLENNKKNNNTFVFSFIIKFLSLLGFKPEMEKCVSCGKNETVGFYLAGGGMVCEECGNKKIQEDKEIIFFEKKDKDDFKILLQNDWAQNNVSNIKICRVIHCFAEYHNGRKLVYFSEIC